MVSAAATLTGGRDVAGDRLAGDLVGYAEDRRLLDSGVRHEEVLELDGVDLVAAPDHDVFDAVEQVDEALGVDAAVIAGVQPAVADRGCGRVPDVSAGDVGSADQQLTGLAVGRSLPSGSTMRTSQHGTGRPMLPGFRSNSASSRIVAGEWVSGSP